MATDMTRITVSITPEIEAKITKLRKTDRFCKSSCSEIVRFLISEGLEKSVTKLPAPTSATK